jgi:hypothetical protein
MPINNNNFTDNMIKSLKSGYEGLKDPILSALRDFLADTDNSENKNVLNIILAHSLVYVFMNENKIYATRFNHDGQIRSFLPFFSSEEHARVAELKKISINSYILNPIIMREGRKVISFSHNLSQISAYTLFSYAYRSDISPYLNLDGSKEDSYIFNSQEVKDIINIINSSVNIE